MMKLILIFVVAVFSQNFFGADVNTGINVAKWAEIQGGRRLGYSQAQCSSSPKCCRNGPNCYDCSGFVAAAWKFVGVTGLPATTRDYTNSKTVRKVSASQAQPGDIVWIPGHVQIFVGPNRICEAANSNTGVVCRKQWIKETVTYYRPVTKGASLLSYDEEEDEENTLGLQCTVDRNLLISLGVSSDNAAKYTSHLVDALEEGGITTRLRITYFLAQILHESGNLNYFEEIASGSAYEGRRDLGNTQRGDGRRFKGRGPIQLTGRANYAAAGRDLKLDLVNNPTIVATPAVGFRTTVWFWTKNNLNRFCDAQDFQTLTRRINGGLNGYQDRLSKLRKANQNIKC